jgi:hypothetical protein
VKLWQRNVIGATVSAVALTVIAATELAPGWRDYRDSHRPEHVVPAGQTGDVAGESWRVASIRHLNSNPSGFGKARRVPEGTILDVVTVERSGPPAQRGCAAVLTDGHRRWKPESVGGYMVLPPEGTAFDCAKPGPMQFSFLIPGDAVPTALDITDPHGRILLRLQL